jgi:hypothetical protein
MQHVPCVLIVDDNPNSLGEIALRILRLGIDVFYAKGRDDGRLMAEQEAARIGVLFFPATLDFEDVEAVVDSLRSCAPEAPRTLVVVGRRPDAEHRKRLRKGGVEWALWEPHDEGGLRSVVSIALEPRYAREPRQELRLPTTLLGRVFLGARRCDAIVTWLSTVGAFLETPSPMPEESLITLEIAIPEGSLVVKARVVHARYPGSGEPQDHSAGMDVEFSNLSPEAQQRLELYLQGIEERFIV